MITLNHKPNLNYQVFYKLSNIIESYRRCAIPGMRFLTLLVASHPFRPDSNCIKTSRSNISHHKKWSLSKLKISGVSPQIRTGKTWNIQRTKNSSAAWIQIPKKLLTKTVCQLLCARVVYSPNIKMSWKSIASVYATDLRNRMIGKKGNFKYSTIREQSLLVPWSYFSLYRNFIVSHAYRKFAGKEAAKFVSLLWTTEWWWG